MNQLKRYGLCLCCLALVLSLAVGCASGNKGKHVKVPDWLSHMPSDNKYFYALGVSGKTRYVKDAWHQASNRARAEMGRTIVSQVSSKDLIITTSGGQYSQQLIDILSDAELNFTEVVERWYDQYGKYGPPHHYYVLIRMKKKTAEAVLRSLK